MIAMGIIREEEVEDSLKTGKHDHERGCNDGDIEFDHDDDVRRYEEP